MDADSFGDASEVLLQQEARLSQLAEEKRALAEENRVLGAAVEALEQKLRSAQRRATEVEARAEAEALAARRQHAAAAATAEEWHLGVEKHRHRSNNDRILLEQAERGRREAEAQLSTARQQAAALAADNQDLQQRLASAQRQLRKLEGLEPFQEQRPSAPTALARAEARVQQLEGRCAELEGELASMAAELAGGQQQVSGQQPAALGAQQDKQRQQGCDSLSLSDLCDLGGAASQFVGPAVGSPQRTAQSGVAGGLPSRRRALQQRQADQQVQLQQQDQGPRCKQHGEPAHPEAIAQHAQAVAEARAIAEREPRLSTSLVESLQQQLQEQQRQLQQLQLQQQAALEGRSGGGAGVAQQAASNAELGGRLQALQGEVEKLQRRNLQLQAALSESSLQHARAATATRQQLQAAQQEASVLCAQRNEAQQQLAALQAAAAVLAGEGDEREQLGGTRGSGGTTVEQLEEMLEYATRCNAAVEQNAALLQEKKSWLEKLRVAEAEAQRCRSEAAQLRLQQLQVGPGPVSTNSSSAAEQALQQRQQQQGREEQLLQSLLEAQAAEAALRAVLSEAREEQVAACRALSAELRRVHALERLRISDMAEVQRLQRRLLELQRECRQLCKALADTQKQLAACGRRPSPAWTAVAGAVQQQHGEAVGSTSVHAHAIADPGMT